MKFLLKTIGYAMTISEKAIVRGEDCAKNICKYLTNVVQTKTHLVS